jgi:hypothetical protein
VALIDFGCGLDRSLLEAVARAASIQSQRDFGRPIPYGYGVSASVRVAASASDLADGELVLGYFPTVNAAAVGFHDFGPNGLPMMHVFPLLDDPAMRGLAETHEIAETLVDPWLRCAAHTDDGRLLALEVCDPVEPSWYPIHVGHGRSIPVSNFVLPAYFAPRLFPGAPLDFLGLLGQPGGSLPGGYQNFIMPGGGWMMPPAAFPRPYRRALADFGRMSRRRRSSRP